MKILLATIAAVAVAALLLLALAAFNLRAFVDAHREELVARGQRALGRAVTIGSVAPSWWPIGIRFNDVVVGEDVRFGTAAFLDAAALRVAVRPGPLALGRVEVSDVVLDRPHIALVRNADGRWNVASLGADSAQGDAARATRARDRPGRGIHLPLFWLGFAASEIRDGRIDVEDRSGPVARRLAAMDVRLRVSELRFGGDALIRLDTAIFPGSVRSDVHLNLHLTRLGMQDAAQTPFTAHLEVEDADLGTLAMVAGRREIWGGRVQRVTADATGTLERYTVDLAARDDGDWHLGPHLPIPQGLGRLDARAEVTRDAIRLERASGAVGALNWTAAGRATLRPWHLDVTMQSPADEAATLIVGGRPLRLTDIRLMLTADEALHFTPLHLRIDDVTVDGTARIASLDPLIVDGRLHATGFAGALDATFDADSGASARLRADAAGLDVGAIAARWFADAPPITGRGALSAVASVPWGAADPWRAMSMTGTARLDEGSLAFVNVVERVLGRMPAAHLLPQLVTSGTRSRFPDVFAAPGTGLRTATVPFTVNDGVVTSSRLAVTAESYEITGDATVDPARDLRFRGDLILSPALSTALRDDFPALRYLARADGRLTLPFHVRGSLDDPVPELDLKRLRGRDLEELVPNPQRADHPGAPVVPAEDRSVERLREMLRP